MRRERTGHSLQTTALVNEAYTRLVDYKRIQWQDRAHSFAVSAQLMRRILVEHARRRNLKRGGGVLHVSLEEAAVVGGNRAPPIGHRCPRQQTAPRAGMGLARLCAPARRRLQLQNR
jgi:hypothetical protein